MGYPTKIQLISRQKGKQWYVNFPNALADILARCDTMGKRMKARTSPECCGQMNFEFT